MNYMQLEMIERYSEWLSRPLNEVDKLIREYCGEDTEKWKMLNWRPYIEIYETAEDRRKAEAGQMYWCGSCGVSTKEKHGCSRPGCSTDHSNPYNLTSYYSMLVIVKDGFITKHIPERRNMFSYYVIQNKIDVQRKRDFGQAYFECGISVKELIAAGYL